MKPNEEIMYRVFEKCKIQICGQTISRELLLKTFGDFLSQTIAKNNHNVGLIMHTGSVCFDAMLVTYATIMNLVFNKAETSDVINSFSDGDTVLYGNTKKSRYIFKGFVDGSELRSEKGKKYIKLAQSESSATYVPEIDWRRIEPYNGASVRLDGRGIRKKTTIRDDFFSDVLDYEKDDIPSILDTSCVIVAPRETADYLVKNISIVFGEKKISLLELVTASYFTEEDEYRYGGNTGKNEPNLKFAAKVSAARQLIVPRKGNRHLGLIVLGEESVFRGYSELPELINRKSLQYVYICTSMDSDLGIELMSDIDESETFACTKDFLLEHTTPETAEQNSYVAELVNQINTIIEKNNEVSILEESGVGAEAFREFKQKIISIKRDEYSTDEKDNFIMMAYSLMKLFVTAPFPMNRFEIARSNGIIDVDTPSEKLAELERLSASFPNHLKNIALDITELLTKIFNQEKTSTGKYEWLRNYLYSNIAERAVIVVPKAYYISLIKTSGLFSSHLFNYKKIITANRFDNSCLYDCVVVLGDYEGRGFSVFRCNAAPRIKSVIYECEKSGYYFKNKASKNRINQLQRKSTIFVTADDDNEDEVITVDEMQVEEFEKEIEEYISNVDLTFFHYANRGGTGYEGSINTDIIAVATFDDDTKAYFSKRYKGYVLDETTGVVKEVEAQDFCDGDSIVFTKNNDETKDIVSSILVKLYLDGRLDSITEDNFRKANLWKNSLTDFMHANNFTARKVADIMLKDGATVHEQTILHWLDEDSHTIGPRKVDSIRHIGNITGVSELKDTPENIFEACREIRSIRRKILDQVGAAIVDKLSGKTPKPGSDMESIFEKVDTLAEIKRIDRIVHVDMVVPMGMANRPISI